MLTYGVLYAIGELFYTVTKQEREARIQRFTLMPPFPGESFIGNWHSDPFDLSKSLTDRTITTVRS